MIGIIQAELQQAIRQKDQHQTLAHRIQGRLMQRAGAEFRGNLRHGMRHPRAVPELAQAVGSDGP